MKAIVVSVAMIISLLAPLAPGAAPRVVSATPDSGQADVDPALRELRIVFDQPMNRGGGWSVVGGGETFPALIGKPRWTDEKTFVWRMKLQPSHEYWLSINSDRFTNFRSAAGEPAEPYPISFTTRAVAGAATAPALTPQDNKVAVTILREAIDQDYSYRDRLKVDWDARFEEFLPRLEEAASPDAFAREAAKLLAAAKDVHITVRVGQNVIGTHRTGTTPNFNLELLAKTVPGWTEHDGNAALGRFDDGIAYVMIPAWMEQQKKGLEAAYAALGDAKAMIIDVRPNGGGDELMAREFAGCFIDEPKVYSKNTIRSGGQFTQSFDRVVEPNKARPAFRGRVVVLMGPKNLSSCESFLLMMRQVPGCKLVGDRSYGSSGNPKPIDLGNGVTVLLPSWVDMLPDGTELEGKGITPDVTVKTTLAELQRRDGVLETALAILRKPAAGGPGR